MAEERVLLPAPFRGLAQEDPAEFWRRLQNYAEYRGLDPVATLRLAKAMLTEEACDWLEKTSYRCQGYDGSLGRSF